jgi:hypothetical protein
LKNDLLAAVTDFMMPLLKGAAALIILLRNAVVYLLLKGGV